MSEQELRARIQPPAQPVEHYENACGGTAGLLTDGQPVFRACYATVLVSCPPACADYKKAVEGAPGIVRVQ